MSIKQLDGANAYQQALKGFQDAQSGGAGETPNGDSVFADMVGGMLEDVRDATAKAEVASAKALVGEADMVEVVTAVSNAEMVVDTVVRVRDKVMGAYQQISKMPL